METRSALDEHGPGVAADRSGSTPARSLTSAQPRTRTRPAPRRPSVASGSIGPVGYRHDMREPVARRRPAPTAAPRPGRRVPRRLASSRDQAAPTPRRGPAPRPRGNPGQAGQVAGPQMAGDPVRQRRVAPPQFREQQRAGAARDRLPASTAGTSAIRRQSSGVLLGASAARRGPGRARSSAAKTASRRCAPAGSCRPVAARPRQQARSRLARLRSPTSSRPSRRRRPAGGASGAAGRRPRPRSKRPRLQRAPAASSASASSRRAAATLAGRRRRRQHFRDLAATSCWA